MSSTPVLEVAASTEAGVADLGVFVSGGETRVEQSGASSGIGVEAAPPLDPDWSVLRRQAANDDGAFDAHVARLRYAKPGRRAFLAASVAAALWITLLSSFVVISGRAPALHDLLGPEGLLFLLIAGAPIGLFFIIAGILRRMAEAQMHAEGLVAVMKSLSQPDVRLPEQVASLGASIRREIAGISDGVERAIGRAIELELQVRAEILHLETAYRDGERRVSGVLNQLRDERMALTGHADTSAEAIHKVRQALSAHVDFECSRLLNSVGDAGNQFGEVVSTHSATIALMMDSQRRQLGLDIESKAAEVLTRFTASLGEVGEQLIESWKTEAKAHGGNSYAVGERLQERFEAVFASQREVFEQAAAEAAKQYEAGVAHACQLLNELGETVAQDLRSNQASLVEEMDARASEFANQTRDAIRSDLSTVLEANFEQFRVSNNVGTDVVLEQVRSLQEEINALKDIVEQTRAFETAELAGLPDEIRGALLDGVGSLAASARSATETFNTSAQKHFNALETSVAGKIAEQRDSMEMLLARRMAELNSNIHDRLEYIHGLLFNSETGLFMHIRDGQTAASYRIEELGKVIRASMNEAVFDLREPLERIIGTVKTIQDDSHASRTAITMLQRNLTRGAPPTRTNSETPSGDLKAYNGLAASISSAVRELDNIPTHGGVPRREVREHPSIRQIPSSSPTPLQPGWLSDLLARASKET
jgi:hypothetical protein